jgi:hypothetical protein
MPVGQRLLGAGPHLLRVGTRPRTETAAHLQNGSHLLWNAYLRHLRSLRLGVELRQLRRVQHARQLHGRSREAGLWELWLNVQLQHV